MTHSLNNEIRYLTKGDVADVVASAPLPAFDEQILTFTDALSSALLAHTDRLPEVVALGFWLRRRHLIGFLNIREDCFYKPLGVVLHITPNNVDTMFVYSWVCAALAGNNNIVRVSKSESPVKQVLLDVIKQVLSQAEFTHIAQRNVFIATQRESQVTAQLCIQADARVIWGGDQTVSAIRSMPSKARCRDISFADRFSGCVINGDRLNADNLTELAEQLHRDTEPFGQQGCSSPKIIFWLGSQTHCQALFAAIDRAADAQKIWRANNHKVVTQMLDATNVLGDIVFANTLTVLDVDQPLAQLEQHCGDGLFYFKAIDHLNALVECIDEKMQTLSYWGVDKADLIKLVAEPSIKGVDRVVKVGQALTFSVEWDGYHLLDQLTRRVVID